MVMFGALAAAVATQYFTGCWWGWAAVAGVVALVLLLRPRVTDVPMDAPTLALLTEVPVMVDPACADVVAALVAAPITDDMDECAEQMRTIVKANHMPYKTLAVNPGALLAASRHFASSSHGALLTRFTVQYNLYAGSVIALGTDEQREQMYATQAAGELGCFAFTEVGAGVLSGSGVESTAIYEPT